MSFSSILVMRVLMLLTLAGACAGFSNPGLPLVPGRASFSSARPSARTLTGACAGSSTPGALFSSARPRLASAALRRVSLNARMQVDDGNKLGDLAGHFADSDIDALPISPVYQRKLPALINSLLVGIEMVLR